MKFRAVDVETANADMASVCSSGAAVFENGELVEEWYSLLDPKDYFDPINISIHGIRESDVIGAPPFKDAAIELNRILGSRLIDLQSQTMTVAARATAERFVHLS